MISKKFKTIKKSKQLIKGNWYIRAVINYRGQFWFEIFQVMEKPYINKTNTGTYNMVKIKQNGYISDHHVSDKIGNTDYETKLFPYSNKVIEFLKKNSGSLRAFFFAINVSKNPSEKDFNNKIEDYQYNKAMDDLKNIKRNTYWSY